MPCGGCQLSASQNDLGFHWNGETLMPSAGTAMAGEPPWRVGREQAEDMQQIKQHSEYGSRPLIKEY